jgi:regulator-associated protein of mTOR
MFMDLRYTTDAEVEGQPASSSNAADPGSSSSTGGCLSASVVRRVSAHSHTMLTLAAHPNAPLIATGGTHGVVKVWTDTGEAVGSVWQRKEQQASRAQGPAGTAQGHPKAGAPVTCLAWHPFNLYLGAGGYDSVASVFIVDNM